MRLVALIAVAACSSKSTPPVGNTQRGSAQVVADVGDCASRVEDWKPGNVDRVAFEDNGKFGYKDGAGKIVIPAQYHHAYEFSPMGVAAVIDGKSPFLFIDATGKVIAQAYAFDNGPDYFQEGHARIVDKAKRVGFMTERGQIVIAPQYEGAASFCHGKAEVELDGKTFYIDKQGNKTTPPPLDPAK